MVESDSPQPDATRRLSSHYVAWSRSADKTLQSTLVSGLVVVDANVLLALYEVAPSAREEVLAVLTSLEDRLWVPHQAVLEFARNRRRVVVDRVSRFKRIRRVVRSSVKDAVDVLDGAVAEVILLREKNRTSREWNRVAVGLDRNSFEARLTGAMDAALKELDELEEEHDLHPGDLGTSDPIFDKIDTLLAGRIGQPIAAESLWKVIDEAICFRYPNNIPPGDRDTGKPTQIAAAGDYLIWWETLQRARQVDSIDEVLLVTSDAKPDWWEFDKNEKSLGPRPELVQEMQDEAGKRFFLASLSDFLDGASEYLSAQVSAETLQQVRSVEAEAAIAVKASASASNTTNLLELSPVDLEALIRRLLLAMGYSATTTRSFGGARPGDEIDLLVRDEKQLVPITIVVQIKRYRAPVGLVHLRALAGVMAEFGASAGLLISTAEYTRNAFVYAEEHSIRLIDGPELVSLLRSHLGIDASI